MFKNVVASMNEALDISLHLKPLRNHFRVLIKLLSSINNIFYCDILGY